MCTKSARESLSVHSESSFRTPAPRIAPRDRKTTGSDALRDVADSKSGWQERTERKAARNYPFYRKCSVSEHLCRDQLVEKLNIEDAHELRNKVVKWVSLLPNIARRHLTKGQQAMALAMIYPEGRKGKQVVPKQDNFSRQRLSDARSVLRNAPKLADGARRMKREKVKKLHTLAIAACSKLAPCSATPPSSRTGEQK